MDAANHEPSPQSSSDGGTGLPPLYQHSVRTEWGLAILAWERDGKRAYQFEDGKLRVFKAGYYELIHEVDRSMGEASAVVADLNRQLGRSENRREREKAGVEGKALLSFDEQVEIFCHMYPGGFQDEAWLRDVRGQEVPRRLKRHRDQAIERVQEKLSAEELDRMIGAEDYAGVCETLGAIFAGTDLLSAKRVKAVRNLKPEAQKLLAVGVREVLHGDDPFELRFRRYTRALRGSFGKISWQVTTVLQALMAPTQHVCVRPSAFREQAAWMAPRLELGTRPTPEIYLRLLEMAMAVGGKLGEKGLQPVDLLDVYDFMWTTLRPAARKVLDEARSGAPAGTTARSKKKAAADKAAASAAAEEVKAQAAAASDEEE